MNNTGRPEDLLCQLLAKVCVLSAKQTHLSMNKQVGYLGGLAGIDSVFCLPIKR